MNPEYLTSLARALHQEATELDSVTRRMRLELKKLEAKADRLREQAQMLNEGVSEDAKRAGDLA